MLHQPLAIPCAHPLAHLMIQAAQIQIGQRLTQVRTHMQPALTRPNQPLNQPQQVIILHQPLQIGHQPLVVDALEVVRDIHLHRIPRSFTAQPSPHSPRAIVRTLAHESAALILAHPPQRLPKRYHGHMVQQKLLDMQNRNLPNLAIAPIPPALHIHLADAQAVFHHLLAQ